MPPKLGPCVQAYVDAGAEAADHGTVVSCDHKTIQLRLHRADGVIFALGYWTASDALALARALTSEATGATRSRDAARGRC